MRPTVAHIDVAAIADNVGALRRLVAPAGVCAVVKANGYGHGSVLAAAAALSGGAAMLGVATVEEGIALREAKIGGPILVLSEPPPGSADEVVAFALTPASYSIERVDDLAHAARRAGAVSDVHLKIDTGMHRVGASPDEAVALARRIVSSGSLRLAGVFTHLAVADEPGNVQTPAQLLAFRSCVEAIRRAGIDPGMLHAANSAGAMVHPDARFDMVRCGVAIYGNAPDPALADDARSLGLVPAMSIRSAVSHVKVVPAGQGVSYGLRWTTPSDRVIATVPIGYADGVARRLSSLGGEVLIRGRRCAMVGRVTMDQLLVDCGPADSSPLADVQRAEEVVLIGRQGDEVITAWDWAIALDTIAYEITCGISPRVPRVAV